MSRNSERWNKRNKKLRAENDYNRVLKEYLTVKHESIVSEFSAFYDSLREKYPDDNSYKGSKKFRTWVQNQIVLYNVENTEENDAATPVVDPPNQTVQYNAENTEENDAATILGGFVADLAADPPTEQQPLQNRNPLENIIANGQQEALEELDELIGGIIRDIENQCDEGIDLSPSHEVEVEPMYYDVEIEGLDDIVLDIEADPLELELENMF